MKATRNICVGTVYREGHLAVNGNLQTRKCLSVNWRGQSDWCQPRQFLDDREMASAVSRRLLHAGLRLLEMAVGDGTYAPVWCRVERSYRPYKRRAVAVNRMWQSWVKAVEA